MEDTRRLATRETITDIRAIADADAIESVVVRGWTVVSKKGEFAVGDACVYIEIDAALPLADQRFAFLEPRGAKTLGDGTKVHVLKTARLRGVYSQGLVLPVASFPEVANASLHEDLASLLGIEKYEPPIPASMEAEVVGAFPTALARKTDAERAQNLGEVWPLLVAAGPWIATEKLDGTSVTVINDSGVVRVCGRNWELVDGPNLYWSIVRGAGVLEQLAPGEVLQAEIYGEGVQGNPLKVRGTHLGVFGFFRGRTSVATADWSDWVAALAVPQYPEFTLAATIEEAVAEVDGIASKVNPTRGAEGVVWARESGEPMTELDGRSSFKVISNKYLLKHG
jgi:RNA ligase (TIGR02306 family)